MLVLVLSNSSRDIDGWQEALGILRAAGHEVSDPGRVDSVEAALPLVGTADALLVGLNPVTREVLQAATRARVVARPGVGMDNVDVAAATELGMLVCNTPGSNADSVADHTMAMILSLIRKLPEQDARTRSGKGWASGAFIAPQLAGKRVAIIGTGNVGKAVARRARGFGVTLVAYDPAPDHEWAQEHDVTYQEFPDVLRGADVVAVHAPLLAGTRGMVGAAELALLAPGAIVVAISRGGVVDDAALVDALGTGRVGGAGVDVWTEEPCTAHPLFGVPNTIVTAHTAGFSPEAARRARVMTAENIVAALAGSPRNVVDPEVTRHPRYRLRS